MWKRCQLWEPKAAFIMFFCHCHAKNFLQVERKHCEIATALLLSWSCLGCWSFWGDWIGIKAESSFLRGKTGDGA